jgi:hypothetical protein
LCRAGVSAQQQRRGCQQQALHRHFSAELI